MTSIGNTFYLVMFASYCIMKKPLPKEYKNPARNYLNNVNQGLYKIKFSKEKATHPEWLFCIFSFLWSFVFFISLRFQL